MKTIREIHYKHYEIGDEKVEGVILGEAEEPHTCEFCLTSIVVGAVVAVILVEFNHKQRTVLCESCQSAIDDAMHAQYHDSLSGEMYRVRTARRPVRARQ
jgi:hypothetical protein